MSSDDASSSSSFDDSSSSSSSDSSSAVVVSQSTNKVNETPKLLNAPWFTNNSNYGEAGNFVEVSTRGGIMQYSKIFKRAYLVSGPDDRRILPYLKADTQNQGPTSLLRFDHPPGSESAWFDQTSRPRPRTPFISRSMTLMTCTVMTLICTVNLHACQSLIMVIFRTTFLNCWNIFADISGLYHCDYLFC